MSSPVHALDALSGRSLLVTGPTGFLGKVTLTMLLDRRPEVGKVYLLVRPSHDSSAEERFFKLAAESPVFKPLRDLHGGGCERFLRARLEVLSGDVSKPELGLEAATLEALAGRIDLVVNIAALVDMHAGLDASLGINAVGARNVALMARRWGAKLVHISTSYVAGDRPGEIPEDAPILGYFPKRRSLHAAFRVPEELAACERSIEHIRSSAKSPAIRDALRRQLLRERGPDGGAEGRALEAAVARRSKRWTEEALAREGRRRARRWGWPNVYCYTKSMGEQAIASTDGLDYAILRPAIVESALRFPFPGWNEGMNTSAPIIFAMLRGQTLWPIRGRHVLDVIPVDSVAGAILTVAAAALVGRHERVYQLGTSDANPFRLSQCLESIGRYRRRHYRELLEGPQALRWLRSRVGLVRVPHAAYRLAGAPARRRAVSLAESAWEKAVSRRVPKSLTRARRELSQLEHVVGTFLPFIHDNDYKFRSDRIRALRARLPAADRAALPWDAEAIDWRSYWEDVHIPGLRRWVFPDWGRFDAGAPAEEAPSAPVRLIRRGLEAAQTALYGTVFKTRVYGASNVPPAGRFIVAANHASHLDMGLIKHALGARGAGLASLAAKDYFFHTPAHRFFFSNFTNLLPIDRDRGLKESLERAGEALRRGRSLLIFPEGTRSKTGRIAPFKPSVGYLALHNQVDILPVYVDGTYETLPKGKALPRGRELSAFIGPLIRYEDCRRLTEHLPRKEAYHAVTLRLEAAVRELAALSNARRAAHGTLPPRPDPRRAKAPGSAALVAGASSGIDR